MNGSFSRITGSLLLALAGPLGAALADKPAAVPVDGLISWIYDYEAGQRLSRETGKPMFVVFRCER